ncbi:hypothetical protein C0993_000595 [Termitomyces sp. T159_Od127]|nr:hypothetical protein C0993_000595 [Termitomyces sp. T159_Od127]
MYRRPSPTARTPPEPVATPAAAATVAPATTPNPQLAAQLLQAVASRAAASTTSTAAPPNAATQSLTAPVHAITNPASFNTFLKNHRASVAFFTSATCGPCRMIEPVFERLAEEKGLKANGRGAGFAKIDIAVGLGNSLASQWNVRATPTFMFFLDGQKLDEFKGADANELKTQVPAIDTVLSKLTSFIDSVTWPSSIPHKSTEVKKTLSGVVSPYLKARFSNAVPPAKHPSATPAILIPWSQATLALSSALPVASLFPLVDLWRLAFLDPAVGTWAASAPVASNPLSIFINKATTTLQNPDSASNPRNFLLTTLRLLSNAFATSVLAQILFTSARGTIAAVLIPSLLHTDALVRTAAASLAFNVAAYLQIGRVESLRGGSGTIQEDGDWEVEMASAIVEALNREDTSEEVVHRLTASLACILRVSPAYDNQLSPLLEVLQARDVLKQKLEKGGCGEEGVTKKDVRKLVEEVANKLCP